MHAMNLLTFSAISLYILSTAGYLSYLIFQKERLHRAAQVLLAIGCICHTLLIALITIRIESLPAHNLHQTLLIAGWCVSGIYLLLNHRYGLKVLGIFMAPLAAMILIAAIHLPREPETLQNTFNSAWVILHVILIFAGEAAFALACAAGILYLVQENAIKGKKRGFFFRRLPSLERLDSVGYSCIIAGFTMLTAGLIGGFLYAKSVWGHFWSWDPKEIWSGIVWIFYAALLHERLVAGWRGRKSAIMSIIGFAALVFTFLGVNLIMEGHHGVFTR